MVTKDRGDTEMTLSSRITQLLQGHGRTDLCPEDLGQVWAGTPAGSRQEEGTGWFERENKAKAGGR